MPKLLKFLLGGEESSFAISKVDRSKLYGYKETEILDEEDSRCEFAVLAEDGSTLIGAGDIGMGYMTVDGQWTSKTQLKPVDIEGNEITPVKSSFDSVTVLAEVVDVDGFLSHDIRLVYSLEPNAFSKKLKDSLDSGDIFKFPYSYRGGLVADSGFLIRGDDNKYYLLVGDELEFDFIGLKQVAAPSVDDELEQEDLMSFDMI